MLALGDDLGAGGKHPLANFASVQVLARVVVPCRTVLGVMYDNGMPDGIPGCFAMFIFQMPFTIGFGGEAIVAEFTFERLFTSMCSHVAGQGALVIARVGTRPNIAVVGCLGQVLLVMALQCTQIGVDSTAKSARKLSP